ncbi:MAG: TrbI/VirB10 family protein, partial [Pseudomonadota bacterium]
SPWLRRTSTSRSFAMISSGLALLPIAQLHIRADPNSNYGPVFLRQTTRTDTSMAAAQPIDPFAALTEATAAYARGGSFPGASALEDPNLQSSKVAFADGANDDTIYNPHRLVDPASPYQVMAGTIIPASLITGLNSDLPGTIIAQVTQPVYDTVSGSYLLIPQGARLIGRYDSQVSFGQDRALVVWDRIIFPDGASLQIAALPGADQAGYSGLSDKVDNQWGRVFTAAGLATLLGIGTELAFDDDETGIARAVRDGFQDTTNQAGQRIVDRNLNVQPTLRVRPGWPLRVIVTRDLILRPYEEGRNP